MFDRMFAANAGRHATMPPPEPAWKLINGTQLIGGTWGELLAAAVLLFLAMVIAGPLFLSRAQFSSPVAGARKFGGMLLGAAPAIALLIWILARSAPHVVDAPH